VSIYYDGGSISLRISVSVCVCNHIRSIIPRFCEGGKIIPAGQWENLPDAADGKIIFPCLYLLYDRLCRLVSKGGG
jgi:hypothetical protein